MWNREPKGRVPGNPAGKTQRGALNWKRRRRDRLGASDRSVTINMLFDDCELNPATAGK
jgi:hypothetical protein